MNFQPPAEGAGLLSAKAIWASIVGPQRLAMSKRVSLQLTNTETRLVYKNLGAADAYVFVGVALPADYTGAPLVTAFSRDDEIGVNTGMPAIITPHMGGGGLAPSGFMQMLMPGEQLYARIVDPAFGGGEQRFVVANASF